MKISIEVPFFVPLVGVEVAVGAAVDVVVVEGWCFDDVLLVEAGAPCATVAMMAAAEQMATASPRGCIMMAWL